MSIANLTHTIPLPVWDGNTDETVVTGWSSNLATFTVPDKCYAVWLSTTSATRVWVKPDGAATTEGVNFGSSVVNPRILIWTVPGQVFDLERAAATEVNIVRFYSTP